MEIQDILERLRANESIRSIHRNNGSHKTIIREVRDLALKKGWLDQSVPLPSEFDILEARNLSTEKSPHPLDRFKDDIKRWKEKGHSFVVIHQLINDTYACSEATVRRYVHKHFPTSPEPVAVRTAIPGEVMEVDFGYVGLLYDPVQAKNRKAWLFSGRLNFSRVAWREIVFDQTQETFFQCHIRAFEYFGGVPRQVVPDNLKAAVIKASIDDPLINRGYRSLARHYEFRINPCRPYTPEHKGGVENDVKYTKRNFMPLFRERSIQRGVEHPSITDANDQLLVWSNETAHQRTIKGVGSKPIDLFEVEKSKLLPLKDQRWDMEHWEEAKVGRDWRVQYKNTKYSVPHEFVGEQVMVCATMNLLRVFHESKEITVHKRSHAPHQDVAKEDHGPPHKQKYLSVTREGLHTRAQDIGPETAKLIKDLLDRPEVDGLKPARKIIDLEKEYGKERLEKACHRANTFGTQAYGSIKNILKQNLDRVEPTVQEATQSESRSSYRFARLMMCFPGLTITLLIQGGYSWTISLS